jgi:hypothetical protein
MWFRDMLVFEALRLAVNQSRLQLAVYNHTKSTTEIHRKLHASLAFLNFSLL